MKLFCCVAFTFAAASAWAQEPPLPSNSPVPSAASTPADATQSPPPALLPAAPVEPVLPPIPSPPDISELDAAFKRTPMGKAAEDYRLHVEWRKLQNRVIADPQVIAARKFANAARTDLEKRRRMRAYYTLYYDRMRAIADSPELKAFVDQQKAAHLGTTAQDRVRPSPSPSPKKEAHVAQ